MRCQILLHDFEFPERKPSYIGDCPTDWGTFAVHSTRAGFMCAGDTVAATAMPGQSVTRGSVDPLAWWRDLPDRQLAEPSWYDEPAATLSYGTTLVVGDLRCTSAQSGLTCTHRPSGRSFVLSKAAYEFHN